LSDVAIINIVLLRDVFHIGLVIGPRPAVLAWGATKRQYSRPSSELMCVIRKS